MCLGKLKHQESRFLGLGAAPRLKLSGCSVTGVVLQRRILTAGSVHSHHLPPELASFLHGIQVGKQIPNYRPPLYQWCSSGALKLLGASSHLVAPG